MVSQENPCLQVFTRYYKTSIMFPNKMHTVKEKDSPFMRLYVQYTILFSFRWTDIKSNTLLLDLVSRTSSIEQSNRLKARFH